MPSLRSAKRARKAASAWLVRGRDSLARISLSRARELVSNCFEMSIARFTRMLVVK